MESVVEMDDVVRFANIKRFENLLCSVKRDGIPELLEFIRNSDFYIAPASTKYHLCVKGGLLQHSLNVYDCLVAKLESPIWGIVLKDVGEDTIIVVSLLHDLCKVYSYAEVYKNQKVYDADKVAAAKSYAVKHDSQGDFIWDSLPGYELDNQFPLGHGSKSVIFILQHMKLSVEETMAIFHHMGPDGDKDGWKQVGEAYRKYPLALALYEADMDAAYLLESESNGN